MSALDDVINDHNLSIRLHDYRMVSFQIRKNEIEINKNSDLKAVKYKSIFANLQRFFFLTPNVVTIQE